MIKVNISKLLHTILEYLNLCTCNIGYVGDIYSTTELKMFNILSGNARIRPCKMFTNRINVCINMDSFKGIKCHLGTLHQMILIQYDLC